MTSAELYTIFETYVKPILEIGLLTMLIYFVLYFFRGTRASNILTGMAFILIVLTLLSEMLKFEVFSTLLSGLWGILATILIVIFQPELRRAFAQLGSTPFSHRKSRKKEAIIDVVNAALNMAKQRIGAIIVFERQIAMGSVVNNAVKLDVKMNSLIIESIFYPNSPLHDGAIVIKNEKIIAAHAILPLSQDESLIRTLGTRHRAAIGITEETDAVALVVSEETGHISIACRGRLKQNIKSDKVLRYLNGLLMAADGDSIQNIFGSMADNDELGFSGEMNDE